jgi:tight adherence protein C
MTDLFHVALQNLSPTVLALVVAAIVILGIVAPIDFEISAKRARARRSVLERHRSLLLNEAGNRRRRPRQETRLDAASGFVQLLAIFPKQHLAESNRLFRQAGIGHPSAYLYFWLAKIISAIVAIALLLLGGTLHQSIYFTHPLLMIVFLAILASFVPDIWLKWKRKGRRSALERSLPDGLDLLVICAEAGLSLDAALQRVAEEFSEAVTELAEELFLTSIELSFLPDRRQALVHLAERVDLADFRGVVATLVQTEKYGTPLAQALRTLAAEFREHRLLEAEEKAARLPAILTVPMILFILPALFIVLGGPAFLKVAEKFGG